MSEQQWLKKLTFIVLFANLLSSIYGIDDNEAHAQILEHLMRDFREIRHTNQYCALFVPPPNPRRGQVQYVPRQPHISQGPLISPEFNVNERIYPQNYAGVTVDINGAVYGTILGRRRGVTVHTEDMALNLVYPSLQNWYISQYGGRNVRDIYTYTYFLPCNRCFQIIQQFVNNNTGVRLYVGYTQLIGGMRENNAQDEAVTRHRRNDIQNFLNDNRGALFQVQNNGQCHQPGYNRIRRDSSNICRTTDELFFIAMDFQNGKAQLWFNEINSDYTGWVELVDKKDKRVTWEWTWGKTTGKKTFNAIIENEMHVRYWKNNRVVRRSYSWDDCGFGYVNLNKLPYYEPNPSRFAKIHLTMKDGKVAVYLKDFVFYNPGTWDYVIVQSVDQIGTESYQTWQWISHFYNTLRYRYYTFSLSGLEKGYRAKYVFYDGTRYRQEGIYDNASPIWTPGECQGDS